MTLDPRLFESHVCECPCGEKMPALRKEEFAYLAGAERCPACGHLVLFHHEETEDCLLCDRGLRKFIAWHQARGHVVEKLPEVRAKADPRLVLTPERYECSACRSYYSVADGPTADPQS